MAADYDATMSLVAAVEGVTLQEGDRLLALCNGELRGQTSFDGDDTMAYMSIAGDGQGALSFAIVRGDDIIATSNEVIGFAGNAISGAPEHPTLLTLLPSTDATRTLIPAQGWYTLQGTKLQQRPAKRGVHIYNGKKQMIE